MVRKNKSRKKKINTLLPRELVIEILLRLPVESLLRCKSVCKLWCFLISDPYFVKSHLKLSTTNNHYAHHRLIFTNKLRTNLKSCPLNDVVFDKSVVNSLDHVIVSPSPLQRRYMFPPKIVGSCNGLVCIVGFDLEDDIMFIWNPSTKLSTRLYSSFDVRLGRDVVYGFGYDESTDDYKVVAIISRCNQYDQSMNQNIVKIYSLKTGNWKQIGDFPGDYPVNMSATFSNGFLHWVATPRGDNVPYCPCKIVSLDLANETYGEVSQPVHDDGAGKVLTLGTLEEWLCVLFNYCVSHVEVWVMKVYGVEDSWTKLVSILYPVDTSSLPLFISNDGKLLLQSGSESVVYDSNNGSSTQIENFDRRNDACTFVESLVSPYPPIRP